MFNKSIALTAAAIVAGLMAFNGADTANARGFGGGGGHFFVPGGGGFHGGMGGWHGGMGGWHGGYHPAMGGWNGGGNWHGNNWHNGNWHHHHDNNNVFFGAGFLGWPYGYYGGDYYPSYGYGYGCNPYTNTYIGADGYRHYCY